jgi:hypothetical protein
VHFKDFSIENRVMNCYNKQNILLQSSHDKLLQLRILCPIDATFQNQLLKYMMNYCVPSLFVVNSSDVTLVRRKKERRNIGGQ